MTEHSHISLPLVLLVLWLLLPVGPVPPSPPPTHTHVHPRHGGIVLSRSFMPTMHLLLLLLRCSSSVNTAIFPFRPSRWPGFHSEIEGTMRQRVARLPPPPRATGHHSSSSSSSAAGLPEFGAAKELSARPCLRLILSQTRCQAAETVEQQQRQRPCQVRWSRRQRMPW